LTVITTSVDPTLTFTIATHGGACNGVAQSSGASSSASAVVVGNVSSVSNGVSAQDLAVTTNAAFGFTVFLRNVSQINDGNGRTIADVAGSNATPGAFVAAGSPGFGYTTSDSALGTGTANRFTNGGAKWAALTSANSEVSFAAAGPVANDTICVGYQVGVSPATPAGTYSTVAIYTAVPLF